MLLWRCLSSLHCNDPSVREKNLCVARKLLVGLTPNLAGAMLKTRGRSSALLLQFGRSGHSISIQILQTLRRALLPLSQNMDSATLPLKPIMWAKVVLQQVLSFPQQSYIRNQWHFQWCSKHKKKKQATSETLRCFTVDALCHCIPYPRPNPTLESFSQTRMYVMKCLSPKVGNRNQFEKLQRKRKVPT